MSTETLKCVVVGDGAVGKTCLLIRYAKNEFPSGYVPTVFDNYAVTVPIAGESYDVHLFDTAGQEDYDQLRKLTFDNTNVFLVCFSVVLWSSFVNIREKWIPELREYCPGVQFILVGTQTDLRYDPDTMEKLTAVGRNPISKQQGEKLAKELNAVKYVECSALTKENVNDVFREAIYIAVSDQNRSDDSPTRQVQSSQSSTHNNFSSSGFQKNDGFTSSNNCCNSVMNKLPDFCVPRNCTIM